MDYCWPGNVRELENAIEHAYVTCQNDQIGLFDLPSELRKMELRAEECQRNTDADDSTESLEPTGTRTREQLMATLKTCGWNKAEAARRLGLNRATVWRKMKQWGIPLEAPENKDSSTR